MNQLNLLIVDDDDLILQSLELALPEQWKMTGAHSPGEVPQHTQFHAAFIDMHMSGDTSKAEGLDLIRRLHREDPHLEIIAMSGNLDRQLMENCLKAGATRYLAKPLSTEEIQLTLEKIEAWFLLQGATHRQRSFSNNWIGSSDPSASIRRQIAELHGESGPILLEGESGTGKEVVAQLIHEQNSQAPFITINVAAVPENLFESELFGHVRGAFTGADSNKMGLAEAAHGGDLFLDEIEALSLPLQVKLLRFLETGEIRRVGAKDNIKVQTRVIVATNRNLDQMVQEEKFREDLLWRISGKKILLPPLRERKKDIGDLVDYFFSLDKARQKKLTDEALDALCSYSWPGNVRELRRVCEQLLLKAPLPVIRREDVLAIISSPSSNGSSITPLDFSSGLPQLLQTYEKDVIQKSLEQFKDVDEVARTLKISRSSLYKKIKDHNIEWRNS